MLNYFITLCILLLATVAAPAQSHETLATDTIYRIRLCADVPDNQHPDRVYYKGEPGHVFIVLERSTRSSQWCESIVWGFYPVKPVSCLLFRKTTGRLVDNSHRSYDASIEKQITKDDFLQIVSQAVWLSKKKYHINRYNCYHYAVELFNLVASEPRLPVNSIKFPFPFGKGGSPCVLYRDLQTLKKENGPLAYMIHMEPGEAPVIHASKQQTTVLVNKNNF
jgi:hypothetical protein